MIDTLPDKLVLMGMSCVGKTTFAHKLESYGYTYHSFDAQYPYRMGIGGISRQKIWKKIINGCQESKFVLDNWSTEDDEGKVLFEKCPDAFIAVIFDTYPNIIKRYRVIPSGKDAHFSMYEKMYCNIDFTRYKNILFLVVDNGNFLKKEYIDFRKFIDENIEKKFKGEFDKNNWEWNVSEL